MSGLIHLWSWTGYTLTKCGLKVTKRMNVLYASTAESLKIPPSRMCKVCYRLGPPWLVAVK